MHNSFPYSSELEIAGERTTRCCYVNACVLHTSPSYSVSRGERMMFMQVQKSQSLILVYPTEPVVS